jgi:nitrate/TMAO reductase-like tetraheme cytochrome c subunit
MLRWSRWLLPLALPIALAGPARGVAGDGALGTRSYDDYEPPGDCADCHVDIARQHEQAMMSQSFVHPWDEIEYFELAAPHADKEPKVAGVKAGCNGCHAPLAFLAGDIPPPRPSEGSRANEGVSCDVCHSITGFEGDIPVNFNWVSEPGEMKRGVREDADSPHEVAVTPFLATAEFCGTCHNEKDPWGLFVKATHLEWKESPQARAGIRCQDCHMPAVRAASADGADERPDVRQHLFHGAHDESKLAGAVEVRVHPAARQTKPGDTQTLTAIVMNAKAGHEIPTGSVEDRVVWLHVEAVDANGVRHTLPVDRKGFEGEEMTIASSAALAYQDLGDIQGRSGFEGLPRDGDVPDGDRIFRMPYLDPKGRMTIAQWNTAAFGPDYRLSPLEAVRETYTWSLPGDLPPGPVTVTAEVYYQRLVSSVAKFLEVPEEEWRPFRMAAHSTTFEVL